MGPSSNETFGGVEVKSPLPDTDLRARTSDRKEAIDQGEFSDLEAKAGARPHRTTIPATRALTWTILHT